MKLIKIQRGNIDNKYVHVCGIDCVYYDNDGSTFMENNLMIKATVQK